MNFDGFIGGGFLADQTLNLDASDTLNLYFEPGSAWSKNRAALLNTPGITLFRDLNLPGAILAILGAGKRLFLVATGPPLGGISIELFADQSFDVLGLVHADGTPAYMAVNGSQLATVSGGFFHIDPGFGGPTVPSFGTISGTVTTTFTFGVALVTWVSGDTFDPGMVGEPITINSVIYTVLSVDPGNLTLRLTTSAGDQPSAVDYSAVLPVTATSLCFLDTYFIISRPNSKQFNISGNNDGQAWDVLDFGAKEGYPDNLLRVFADHEDLWLYGDEQSTEVWQNTGAGNFPFQRIPGDFIHYGLAAKNTPARLGDGVAWLARDTARGFVGAVHALGFQPKVISTPAVEQAWAAYPTLADAWAYSYIDRGHQFWVINFPSAPTAGATWAYDLTTNQWARRGWWNGALSVQQRQVVHAYTDLKAHIGAPALSSKHFVGDRANGKIYLMDSIYPSDDGTAIERVRTCAHFPSAEHFNCFYHRLEVYTEVRDDAMTVSSAKDGGHTFGTPRLPSATSVLGAFLARTFWNILGMSRDRVFRVRSLSSTLKQAWIAAYVEFTQGTS